MLCEFIFPANKHLQKPKHIWYIYKLWENESFTESFLSVCVSLLKILMTRMIHLSLLCMTWEYIFLKNAMWEEVHQQLITSATFFKIKAALPTYFLFFMFSFSIAELDHLICGFCGWNCPYGHSESSYISIKFQGQNTIQTLSRLFCHSFKCLQNIRSIYNLILIISSTVNNFIFLKTLYTPFYDHWKSRPKDTLVWI